MWSQLAIQQLVVVLVAQRCIFCEHRADLRGIGVRLRIPERAHPQHFVPAAMYISVKIRASIHRILDQFEVRSPLVLGQFRGQLVDAR